MENASKALIMAGEILIAILILTLLLYAWGKYSEYKNEEAEIDNIENVAKFNEQFTNYDRKDVEGHEILTLINKIVDYNERNTSDSTINADTYKPITITLNLINLENIRKDLTRDGQERLFTREIYREDAFTAKNRNSSQSFAYSIINKITSELNGLEQTKAEKIAKNIENIFLTEEDIERKANSKYNGKKELVYQDMLNTYNYNAGFKKGDRGYLTDVNKLIITGPNSVTNKYYSYACHFYEYMQFKRCFFECIEVKYEPSGRVSQMDFKYSGIK